MTAVQIKKIDFGYNKQQLIIKNLDLTIPAGDRFGIFGPNGAGKTTLMNLMAGLLSYKKGSIQLLGKEIKIHKADIKKMIGLVPQDFSFYAELTPEENLEFFGAWYGLDKIQIRTATNTLLETMGLTEVAKKPVKYFSGGMKRRINLAIGVMHHPKILFLDEPTVGVDVQSRNAIVNFLKKINEEGTTLVYTSHQLNEAEELCESVALMDQGEMLVQGALADLLKEHRQPGLEGLFLHLTGRAYRD